jgi:hypothetical protein
VGTGPIIPESWASLLECFIALSAMKLVRKKGTKQIQVLDVQYRYRIFKKIFRSCQADILGKWRGGGQRK